VAAAEAASQSKAVMPLRAMFMHVSSL